MSSLSTIAIIVAIIGLIFMAYRGWSIILIAPIMAVVAAIGCGDSILSVIQNVYLIKAAEYIGKYFPVFLFGESGHCANRRRGDRHRAFGWAGCLPASVCGQSFLHHRQSAAGRGL